MSIPENTSQTRTRLDPREYLQESQIRSYEEAQTRCKEYGVDFSDAFHAYKEGKDTWVDFIESHNVPADLSLSFLNLNSRTRELEAFYKKMEDSKNNKKDPKTLDCGKYTFLYTEGEEREYRVLIGPRDVTESVKNDALTELFVERLMREKEYAQMTECRQAILRLQECFPGSFVNNLNEFIASRKTNTYFLLGDCKTEEDIKCKVLERLTHATIKLHPYHRGHYNLAFQQGMAAKINKFLETDFSREDFEQIYISLGNCCNHELTQAFVRSGYDMNLLQGKQQSTAKEADVVDELEEERE